MSPNKQPSDYTANGLSKGLDKSGFKILFWNAGGLTFDKLIELRRTTFIQNVDVVGVVESGAATENPQKWNINGFATYTLKRSRQVASGIILYVRDCLTAKMEVKHTMTGIDKLEAVRLEVWKGRCKLNLFVLYNPPNNHPDLECLQRDWDEVSLIVGDFNAHSRRWGYLKNDAVGNIVEDFIDSGPVEFMDNVNHEPTFLSYAGSSSHPDLLLVHPNLASRTEHSLLSPPGGQGHKMLLTCVLNAKHKWTEPRHTRWNLKKANWHKYGQLTDIHVCESLMSKNTEESCKRITEAILKCAIECVPRGQIKKFTPFWNGELEMLKRERDQARRIAGNTGLIEDCIELRLRQAAFKKAIIKAKRSAYSEFLEKLDFRRDGVRAHKFISRINGEIESRKQPIKVGSKELTSDLDIAKSFCKYYANVSNYRTKTTIKKSDLQQPFTCLNRQENILFDSPFTQLELEAVLKELDKGKSAGPDGLVPEFLIHLGKNAKSTVLRLANATWIEGYFPSEWRKAEVIPILKNGKTPDELCSFRPISLTSVLCKLVEKMVTKRLQQFLENGNYISDRQAGFRRYRGTVEQIVRLTQEIKDGFHRKQSSLAVFIDFKAAFDKVWRRLLIMKMTEMGVDGRLLRWIKLFLEQRYIRVRYGDSVSGYRQTKQGLPQGSVLSPYLFDIMIDDIDRTISSKVPGVQVLLFADDVVIWGTSSHVQSLENALNKALVALAEWCDKNEMAVNPDKTTFQLFTLSTKNHDVSLSYRNKSLQRTDSASYLGVTLDSKLTWDKHANKAVKRGTGRTKLLKRLTGTKWGASQDVLSTAYKSYVRPAMEYGSELLITASGPVRAKLDKCQNQALRIITGAAKSTPIPSMEIQAGIEPLDGRREIAAVKLFEKLARTNSHFWSTYQTPQQRLKTQQSFLSKVETVQRDLQLPVENRLPLPQLSSPPLYLAKSHLDLLSGHRKCDGIDLELRNYALETIEKRFPVKKWLHIYTDGSATDATRNAGAGVYCRLFEMSAPVGVWNSSYDGEVAAIKMALEELRSRPEKSIVLLVDSLAAIQAVTSPCHCDDSSVLYCRDLISSLIQEGREICLQWVPSHCGLVGNERADSLAKEGSRMPQTNNSISLHTKGKLVKSKYKEQLQQNYKFKTEGKRWACLLDKQLPYDLPRSVSVANFRLTTGHDYLQQHLHRIGVVDSPICPLCNESEMNGEHLPQCTALQDISKDSSEFVFASNLYWAARGRMAERPQTGVG